MRDKRKIPKREWKVEDLLRLVEQCEEHLPGMYPGHHAPEEELMTHNRAQMVVVDKMREAIALCKEIREEQGAPPPPPKPKKKRVREDRKKTLEKGQTGRIVLTTKNRTLPDEMRVYFREIVRTRDVPELVVFIKDSLRTELQLPRVVHETGPGVGNYQVWSMKPCQREGHHKSGKLILVRLSQEVEDLGSNYYTAEALYECTPGRSLTNGMFALLNRIEEYEDE